MKLSSQTQHKFQSTSLKVHTGNGTMYVFVLEDTRGVPVAIQATIGKCGTALFAWAYALAELANTILDKGGTLNEIIQALSNITSDNHSVTGNKVPIRSGPEGFKYALEMYQQDKRDRANRVIFRRVGNKR